jgi:hypothetical protein
MTFLELVGVLLLATLGAFAWFGLKAREAANAAMRATCRARGLLFLDDTVALAAIRPVRDEDGRVTLRRVYGFEFSDTGDNRRRGAVTLLGTRIVALDLGEPPVGLPASGSATGPAPAPTPDG